MKNNIFIILVTILLILILLYFYDKREEVLNKELNNQQNIHIEYPYFNNQTIDNYLNQYLNQFIKNKKDTLFIDYDYQKEKEIINLTMYIYEKNNNIIKTKEKHLKFNTNTNTIHTIKKEKEQIYDIYSNKSIDKSKPFIALTFDDGPNYNTNKVLKILEKYHVKATFFILGINIKGNEKTIKKMDELGMEIGNHMYSHKLVTKLNQEQIKEEINKTDKDIEAITGKIPTLIRPSYGIYNNAIKQEITRPIITWNIDTLDWKYHNSKKIYNKVMNNLKDGSIILMHDIYNATANSLELLIPKLLENNYQLVTVSELMYYTQLKQNN